jgi:hypothetical protein
MCVDICDENWKEYARKGLDEANNNFRDLHYGNREPDPENETDNEMYWRGRRDAFGSFIFKKIKPSKKFTHTNTEITYHHKED